MGFTIPTSGSVIHATDITQFSDFLTGAKQDVAAQIIALLKLKSRGASPAALTAGLAAGGSIDVGAHDYAVTFVGPGGGETLAGTHTTLTTTTGNQTANLSVIPTGPTGTASRNIYRSKVGTTSPLFLLHTINDNTTTVYTDTVADSSLPATQSPTHPSFGGSTQWQDNTGTTKAQIFSDGAVSFDGGAVVTDGTGNLTLNGGVWSNGQIHALGAGTGLAVTNNATIGGTLQLSGAMSKVNGVSTAGPYGVAVEAAVTKDTVVSNTTATNVLTFTTPNDATNHHFLVTAEWFVGGSNTNSGVCTLSVTFTDPHAGAVTLNFTVYGTTNSVSAFTLGKGLVGRCFPRSLNVSPNTTITVTYQNTAAGTISDTVSTSLLMLA